MPIKSWALMLQMVAKINNKNWTQCTENHQLQCYLQLHIRSNWTVDSHCPILLWIIRTPTNLTHSTFLYKWWPVERHVCCVGPRGQNLECKTGILIYFFYVKCSSGRIFIQWNFSSVHHFIFHFRKRDKNVQIYKKSYLHSSKSNIISSMLIALLSCLGMHMFFLKLNGLILTADIAVQLSVHP